MPEWLSLLIPVVMIGGVFLFAALLFRKVPGPGCSEPAGFYADIYTGAVGVRPRPSIRKLHPLAHGGLCVPLSQLANLPQHGSHVPVVGIADDLVSMQF